MSFNLDDYPTRQQHDNSTGSNNEPTPSPPSSPVSSTSSSSSTSDGSSSSSELNPSDALQSPLTGLLNFEGFSMPQMRNFGISNLDMPNLPSLPNLRSFNMPRFQPRLPNLANNFATNLPNLPNLPNLGNFTTNIPNFTNLSYLTQLRDVNTVTEMQNLFNLFRISANLNLRNLPNLPTLPQLPQFPQFSQLAPFFAHFSGGQLLKSWVDMKDSVRNMHHRLNEITQRFPNNFHFREWQTSDGQDYIRIYFLLNELLYYCDSPLNIEPLKVRANESCHYDTINGKHINSKEEYQQLDNNKLDKTRDNDIMSTRMSKSHQRQHHNHRHGRRHYHHHHHQNNSKNYLNHDNTYYGAQHYRYNARHNSRNQNFDQQQQQQEQDQHDSQYHQPSPSTSSNESKHCQTNSTHNTNTTTSNGGRHEILNTQPLHQLNLIVSSLNRIDTYEYDPKSSRFVFSNGNHLYYFDDPIDLMAKNGCQGISAAQNQPIKIETKYPHSKSDFRICPSNSDLVAYHCQGDIWCVNLKTSQELRLTDLLGRIATAHDTHRTPLGDYLSASFLNSNVVNEHNLDALPYMFGKPSHVIREEFRRHHGFWWRPETEYHVVNSSEEAIEYQILYEETDQSQVELIMMPSHNGTIEGQRFPKTGSKNPVSRLKIAKFKLSSKGSKFQDVVITDALPELSSLYPDFEYLVRAGWLGQDVIWCQMLNRRQTSLVIALISLSGSFESQIIYEEHNDYWVSVHDIFYILNSSKIDCQPLVKGSELSFIWSSEESGFRHLYLIKVKLGSAEMSPKMLWKKQLTEGSWEINEKDFWVDEENMWIFFCGLRDTPLERHLYVLRYADSVDEKLSNAHGKNRVHRLTELNYTQSSIAFNPSRSIFVNIQSNISVPPFGFLNRIVPHTPRTRRNRDHSRRLPESKRLALLLVNSFIYYSSYESPNLDNTKTIEPKPSISYDCQADLLPGLGKPELFCCRLPSGELIYGSIFKPEFMESGVRYPTVLEIYGGPEIQLVSNNFMSLRQPKRHLLSSEGYVVILIDCRGSGRRGLSFESHSFRRMGQVEVIDQVYVLQWLAKNTGYIDLARVAVKGWSYGGYLALMALAQYPKIFKVAIAGAPVTNWLNYDTAYTERFMGFPQENTEGYFKGNVLSYIQQFPDEGNRLLLLHGMMDENVHFSHTVALVNALIEAGKPYDLQVFPTERHILKSTSSCENYMTCVLSYLQLNL